VVDLGCWPGGWLQVAAAAVGPEGRVVGVDRVPIEPTLGLENVISIEGDLADPGLAQRVLEALGGRAHVVLSDAAPKLTGVRATDRAQEEALLEAVAALVPHLLASGGSLVVKLLESPEARAAARQLGGAFEQARTTTLESSRRGSSEQYLVGRGFHGGARR
jgi:23S rRNA (uridine2552-2'-O)-methyltransferase